MHVAATEQKRSTEIRAEKQVKPVQRRHILPQSRTARRNRRMAIAKNERREAK